ncbi:MAG TPA: Gfo/Idh/MocA family oxidoreductase [Candidatus Poseidoniales archaeon]|nr:Gfo/Idh/MocA family oxidoreductase [Candidatus Poseidoniales archaeon]
MALTVGILGAGRWGQVHIRTLTSLKQEGLVEQLFVCDTDADKLANLPSAIDATFSSWQEMVKENTVDLVAIVTPPETHCQLSIELMSHGIDVLVEKPLGFSETEAASVLSCSRRTGQSLSVGFLLRFHSGIQKAKAMVSNGVIGSLHRIEFTRHSTRNAPLGGDVIEALGVHAIDTVCSVQGEVEPQRLHISRLQTNQQNRPIQTSMWLEFPGGIEANISVAWASQSEQRQLNFIGELGTIFVDFNNHENIQLQNEKGFETIATEFSTPPLEMEWRQLLSPLSQQNNAQPSQFPTPGATLRAARWIEQAIIGATDQIGEQQTNPPRD